MLDKGFKQIFPTLTYENMVQFRNLFMPSGQIESKTKVYTCSQTLANKNLDVVVIVRIPLYFSLEYKFQCLSNEKKSDIKDKLPKVYPM